MTNTLELEIAIKRRGLSKKAVAKHLGLSEQGFLLKLNNSTEFKASEIQSLVELLELPDKSIFFEKSVI